MKRCLALAVALAVVAGCGGSGPTSALPARAARATAPASNAASASPTVAPTPVPTPVPTPTPVADVVSQVSLGRMWADLQALCAVQSRDPRHPGHAKAVAYILGQLQELAPLGVKVQVQPFTAEGIPMENILAIVDPPGGAPATGGIVIGAHYDTIGKWTPGWRPAIDPAPGADDNGTGTAAVLEIARILARERASLKERVVLGFWDGEELYYKGTLAFVGALQKPYAYSAFINPDTVGWNPIADRLDVLWWGSPSAALRDRVATANDRYAIGVKPLVNVLADDPRVDLLDSAPFGMVGIPAVTLAERYGPPDATYPGSGTMDYATDTIDKIDNPRLWTKAAKLTLAVGLELARR
ncbi:MAG: M20/M25/M40 family metallo-hydrolase [Chloroflexota bacterium]|nr:M20/M25/M40 family metallo-hydrolase [Chloroflexota bacterium]